METVTSGFHFSPIPRIVHQSINSSALISAVDGALKVFSNAFYGSSYGSYIEIQEIPLSDTATLCRHSPLVVGIKAIDDDGCMTAYIPGIDNLVSGYSLAEINDACLELIAVLWEEYTQSDDDALTEHAQELKAHLIETFVKEDILCKEGK